MTQHIFRSKICLRFSSFVSFSHISVCNTLRLSYFPSKLFKQILIRSELTIETSTIDVYSIRTIRVTLITQLRNGKTSDERGCILSSDEPVCWNVHGKWSQRSGMLNNKDRDHTKISLSLSLFSLLCSFQCAPHVCVGLWLLAQYLFFLHCMSLYKWSLLNSFPHFMFWLHAGFTLCSLTRNLSTVSSTENKRTFNWVIDSVEGIWRHRPHIIRYF